MATGYSFPYKVHFDFPIAVEHISGAIKGDEDPVLAISEMISIRNRFDELDELSDQFDYVASFALGGIVPLNYITTKRFQAGADDQLLRDRFHLFAGLGWRTKQYSVQQRFLQWIDSLPNGSSILVFDTGNFGHGANAAYNVLRGHLLGDSTCHERVAVRGIVSTPDACQQIRYETIGPNEVDMDIEYPCVQANLFEDACHIEGYNRLRDVGAVKSIKSTYTLVVTRDDGTVLPIPSCDAGGVFQWLLRGGIERLQQLNPADS